MSEVKNFRCDQCGCLLEREQNDPQWHISHDYYRNSHLYMRLSTDDGENEHLWYNEFDLDFCSESCVSKFISDVWEKRERIIRPIED